MVFPQHTDAGTAAPASPQPAVKTSFSASYQLVDDLTGETVGAEGEVKILPEFADYQTLYLLSSRIHAARGAEICRAGTICSLVLELEQVSHSSCTSLMYEVSFQTSNSGFNRFVTCLTGVFCRFWQIRPFGPSAAALRRSLT